MCCVPAKDALPKKKANVDGSYCRKDSRGHTKQQSVVSYQCLALDFASIQNPPSVEVPESAIGDSLAAKPRPDSY